MYRVYITPLVINSLGGGHTRIQTAGGLGCPIQWFQIYFIVAFLVLGCYFFTPGVFWLRFHFFFNSISFEWSWLNSFDHTSCVCWHFKPRRLAWPVHAWFFLTLLLSVCMCVYVRTYMCVCVCVRACVRVCVCVCVPDFLY